VRMAQFYRLAYVITSQFCRLRLTHNLAMGLSSTRLKALMRSNKSGRLSRCTRLRSRRGTTVISTYNLAQQMANLPASLYQRYATPLDYLAKRCSGQHLWECASVGRCCEHRNWSDSSATKLQRSTSRLNTLCTSSSVKQSQRIIATQAATSDLGDGIVESNLQTLGRCALTQKHENQTSGSLRLRHTRLILAHIQTWPLCSGSIKQPLCSSEPSRTQIRFRRPQFAADGLAKAAARCIKGHV
jgi:hypothetical protein